TANDRHSMAAYVSIRWRRRRTTAAIPALEQTRTSHCRPPVLTAMARSAKSSMASQPSMANSLSRRSQCTTRLVSPTTTRVSRKSDRSPPPFGRPPGARTGSSAEVRKGSGDGSWMCLEGGREMVTIGFVLLGAGILAGVLVTVLLAVADPVLLSRVNGEPAQGASGCHIEQDRVSQD